MSVRAFRRGRSAVSCRTFRHGCWSIGLTFRRTSLLARRVQLQIRSVGTAKLNMDLPPAPGLDPATGRTGQRAPLQIHADPYPTETNWLTSWRWAYTRGKDNRLPESKHGIEAVLGPGCHAMPGRPLEGRGRLAPRRSVRPRRYLLVGPRAGAVCSRIHSWRRTGRRGAYVGIASSEGTRCDTRWPRGVLLKVPFV